MNKYFKYLRYILIHKYYVGRACFRHGLYWRGVKHDWSKFFPSEFFPYLEYFYGNNSQSEQAKVNFNRAWLYHQKRNDHHWQYWIMREDSGNILSLEMPEKAAIEMVCDWEGAGLAINGKNDLVEWYGKNKNKIILNDKTRELVEKYIYKNEE